MIKQVSKQGKVKYYKVKKFIKLLNKGELNVEDNTFTLVKPIDELNSVTR